MKTPIAIVALLILLSGCSKSTSIQTKEYAGTFGISSPNDVPLELHVHIAFNGVNFSGGGDSSVLPYVGTGVFKLTGDSIYFTQTGGVPDIFGRGSILEGGFLLERNADSLLFGRKSPAGITGQEVVYKLKRI